MNTGIIAHRYAATLFKFVLEEGCGRDVYEQTQQVLQAFSAHSEFADLMRSKVALAQAEILSLFDASVHGKLCPALEKFICLVRGKGRLSYLPLIFNDFEKMYLHHCKIAKARIVSCRPLSDELRRSIVEVVKESTGEDLLLSESVDTSLIGGFILEVSGYTLDASARHQLDMIRNQFVERNRRIV